MIVILYEKSYKRIFPIQLVRFRKGLSGNNPIFPTSLTKLQDHRITLCNSRLTYSLASGKRFRNRKFPNFLKLNGINGYR